jgi:hypothetical protein
MSQVNDLGAFALEDAAHNVDGSIVAVKQRSGSDNTDFGLFVHFSKLPCKITLNY